MLTAVSVIMIISKVPCDRVLLCLSSRWRSDFQAWCVQERQPAGDDDVGVLRPQRGAGVLRRRQRRRLHLEGTAAAENSQSPRWAGVRHVLPRQGEDDTCVCVCVCERDASKESAL